MVTNSYFILKAHEMLSDFSLEEILEFNDLSEEEALAILIETGMISEPEIYFK